VAQTFPVGFRKLERQLSAFYQNQEQPCLTVSGSSFPKSLCARSVRLTLLHDLCITKAVDSLHTESSEEIKRLIDWNVEVLLKLLKKVIAKREASGKAAGWDDEPFLKTKDAVADEVVAVIELPPFDPNTNKNIDYKSIQVPSLVEQQLKDYVSAVAVAYRSNPFSGLQHASHVASAVTRLVSRIAVPNLDNPQIPIETAPGSEEYDVLLAEHIHTQSYGIASDPLTQFSVVLAGLVHAVDHRGVNNEILAKENPDLAAKYNNKSITEQLSLEKAWKKLMEPDFENLRRSLYADLEEKKRFRSILVNAVMATDQADEQGQARRAARWEKSFGPGAAVDSNLNQKATCVIECLMQSADEFHAMLHWVSQTKGSLNSCFSFVQEVVSHTGLSIVFFFTASFCQMERACLLGSQTRVQGRSDPS
jgi:3'5'-cyclic nucleotide phosphodiesterase